MVEVCRRAIGSQANIKKISLGSLLGLLAHHHDLGADVHPLEQVSDVLVEHADAAGGRELADRLWPVGENHIKAWKTHLAADRTSCTKATANQFRLFLHAGAYWLLGRLRALTPKRSPWRVAQFDTLRLRLIKIAARVVELKTQIRLHLPTACPDQAILRVVLGQIPRLVT